MKKNIILSFLTFVFCFSCNKAEIEVDGNAGTSSSKVQELSLPTYFSHACECRMPAFSTQGLKQYKFNSFEAEELKKMDYDERVRRRQIPDEFLKKMNTHELFIQFIHMDMAKEVLVFNTIQQGFRTAIGRYNSLQELFRRDDIADYFTKKLQEVNLKEVKGNECHFYYLCLQMLSAQKEVIAKMNKSQILNYINTVSQLRKELDKLSLSDKNWQSRSVYEYQMIGYANIMLKYKYSPFIKLILSNEKIRSYTDGITLSDEELMKLIESYMVKFYKQLKDK